MRFSVEEEDKLIDWLMRKLEIRTALQPKTVQPSSASIA
jgi:hypothetical protein